MIIRNTIKEEITSLAHIRCGYEAECLYRITIRLLPQFQHLGVHTHCKSPSRRWTNNSQCFPMSYVFPLYDVYTTEMWVWGSLYTLHICEVRNGTTCLEVSANYADLSCLPGHFNHFPMLFHTTFRKVHTNSIPHYIAHLHILVYHWVSTKRCLGVQHTYHLKHYS